MGQFNKFKTWNLAHEDMGGSEWWHDRLWYLGGGGGGGGGGGQNDDWWHVSGIWW